MVQFCYFRLYLGIKNFSVDCCYGDGTDAEELENIGHFFPSCFHAMPAKINETKYGQRSSMKCFASSSQLYWSILHCVDTKN